MVFDPNVFDSDVFDAGAATNASAGIATGSGAAHDASCSVAPSAGLASGTGAALDAAATTQASTAVDAELATGAGAANNAAPHVAPSAEAATGTGTALDATATTTVFVFAGAASGSGAAAGPAPSIAPSAGGSSGTGSASDATATTPVACEGAFQSDAFQVDAFQICGADVSVNAGLATGTGQAYDAIGFIGTGAYAETATGTGSALGATPSVAPHAGAGAGYGAAHQTMVVGVATGTGTAHDAAIFAEDSYGATPEGDIATGYMPPLAAPIDDNDTTITVTTPSTTNPDEPFVVIIGGEQILVTNVSGTTWTVVRGYNGSTATAHGAGAIARPALVRIRVAGVDITPDVDYRRSRFTTGANGQAGIAEIWVRDLERTHAFVTGAEVLVSFRGVRQWGGYLASIRRQYVFPEGTGRIGDEPRYLLLDCVDYNVLFNKRVFFKPGDADHMAVKHWPNGTWDAVVISELVRDFLTLEDDGLRFDITHVGTPALPQISCDPNAPDDFGIGSAGWTWGQVMQAISSQTGAVYYIDPDKVFRYVDDSVKQSRFGWSGLSDAPDNVTTIGYRDVEFTSDGTRLTNDHLQWGAGQGSDQMIFARTTDQDSIDEHGLWQSAEVRFDMWCQESVDLRGETWVYGSPQNRRGGKDDRFFSRVTVREPYFRVADVVELESNAFNFTQIVPVRNAEITFPTPWDIRAVLTLSHELDAPWGTLEFWLPQFNFELPNFDFPDFPDFPPFPDPWLPFDPCDCLEFGDFEPGCVDTFTRSSASGLGTGELGAWTPNVNYKVELNRGVAMRNAAGGSETTITDYTITAPGCIRWDTRPFGTSSGSFGGGMVLAARQGNRVPASILQMSYSIRLNYSDVDGSMAVQYSALGDDTTSFTDRGVSGLTVISDYPADEDVTWELHFSDDEIRVVGYPTLTPSAIILDDTVANDPAFPSTNHYHLGFVDQIVVYNALTTDVGSAGEEAFKFDNINVCCDDAICSETVGESLGLTGGGSSHPLDDFNRADSPEEDFRFGTASSGIEWDHNADYSYIFNGKGEMTPEVPVGTAAFSGAVESFPLTSCTDVVYPLDVSVDFSSQFGTNDTPVSGDNVLYTLIRVMLWGADEDDGAIMEAWIELTKGAILGTTTGFYIGKAGAGSDGTTFTHPTNTIVADTTYTLGVHAGTDEVSISLDGTEMFSRSGLAGGTQVPVRVEIRMGDGIDTGSGDDFFPVIDLSSFDIDQVACGGGDNCADAAPGELADPPSGGPADGVEPRSRDDDPGPNGGVVFHTQNQYQLGSAQVWVDGLRLRIGADYVEYPRQAMIEILDPVAEDAEVLFSYIIWTIDDPIPE